MKPTKTDKCNKVNIFGKRYLDSNINKLYWDKNLLTKLDEWMDNPDRFLIILGGPGTGKTYLCSALWNWATKFKTKEHFKSSRSLILDDDMEYDDSIDELYLTQKLKKYNYCSFDSIEDKFMSWSIEEIKELIDVRYCMESPTVVTSSLTFEQIANTISPRVASRLMAKENVVIDLFALPDFRLNPPTL